MTIRELLLLDSDLLIKILSLYYPFREVDVRDYWCVLEKGTAHYSVYMSDTEAIYSPEFGAVLDCIHPSEIVFKSGDFFRRNVEATLTPQGGKGITPLHISIKSM